MHSSILQTPLADDRIRCEVCQWRCALAAGEVGRCRVRSHHDNAIIVDAYGLVSAATIGPIEDQRLWHFFPDAQVFNVGAYGTPLAPPNVPGEALPYAMLPANARELSPERVVEFAQQRLCRGVLWTFGDPSVAYEWVLDGIKLGRAASRFTAIATTGYFNPELFSPLAGYLDGMRLDVYGFSAQSYQALTGFDDWQSIFRLAAEARQKWNIHVEVALHLTPGVNDSDQEVSALAKWMRVALGSLTPLHVLPNKIGDAQPDAETLQRVQATAKAAGVSFVYGPTPHQVTRCPNCTWVVIERSDGPTQLTGVIDDACEGCRTPLGLRTSLFRRNVRYEVVS
jgi:pyruvate formate lyase activating enzyme